MGYKLTAVLATPDILTDEDVVYPLNLPDKRALHRVQKALHNAQGTLIRLTENELESGVKPFGKSNPTLMVLDVQITKDDGTEYWGTTVRYPNQDEQAQAFLRGLFDGVFAEVGYRKAKQKMKKVR